MFCKKCGNQLPDDAKFCKKCGTKVNGGTEIKEKLPKDKVADTFLVKEKESTQNTDSSDKKITETETKNKKKAGRGCLTFILKLLFGLILAVLILFGLIYMGVFSGDSLDSAPIIENEQSEEKELTLEERKEAIKEQLRAEAEPIEVEFEDADEYYENNSEVVATIEVDKSDKVQSEYDVTEYLEQRGFGECSVLTEYSMDGEYSDEYEISATDEKHPVYQVYYTSANNELWTISITNGSISAYPVVFNMYSGLGVDVVISETETVMAYDSVTNKFYETVPYESALIVKVVDRIDADTLDRVVLEVVENVE